MSVNKAFFGIDLGTSNSSIAYVVDDPRQRQSQLIDVKVVSTNEAEGENVNRNRLPTLVSRNFTDKRKKRLLIGWEVLRAIARHRRDTRLNRHGVDFFRSVKSDMGSNRVYPRAFSEDCNTPVKVSAKVIDHLIKLACRRLSGQDPREAQVVITVPASFNALAREDTLKAAYAAGLQRGSVKLLDEPVAALLDLLNDSDTGLVLDSKEFKNLLVFDCGGGTCDLTLVKARFDDKNQTGIHVETLAISQYRQLGGDDIDRRVMSEVVWPLICDESDKNKLNPDTRRRVEDTLTYTVARGLKERLCCGVAVRLEQDDKVWEKLQRSLIKVDFSTKNPVWLREINKKIPHRFEITSDQFEKAMAPFLEVPGVDTDLNMMAEPYPQSLCVPVFEVLQKAGLGADRLDTIILHGGSCRNPYVRKLFEQNFQRAGGLFGVTNVIPTPDLDASVARGAALACYWKHARGVELVRPIMVEDLGVMTFEGDPVRLVSAGTPLPYPGEEGVNLVGPEFHVLRDGQPELLVPIYTGSRYKIAGSVKIPLPSGMRQGAAVRIKLAVNADKILSWWFNMQGASDLVAPSFNDPWTMESPSPEWQNVIEHRRLMRQTLEERGTLPSSMELTESVLLYRAGRLNESRSTVEDYIVTYGDSGVALNLKALNLWDSGKVAESVEVFQRAVELQPNSAIIRGNYGCALFATHRIEEATAAVRSALDLNPDLTYLYEWLGDFYRDKGEEASAVREYTRAKEFAERDTRIDPSSLSARQRKERIYRKLGEYDKADETRRETEKIQRDALYQGDSSNMMSVQWRKAD